MGVLILMLACFAGYIIAYHTYGRFLARRIFQLDPTARVPSQEKNDGIDYVPTRRGIVFGHHFTSIAGTGPIVGPAIGIIWGWLPALLWVTVGCVLMGAVHDLGALVVSLRNEGKSLSEIAARYFNTRVRLIFFLIVFFALLIIIAIFGIVIATVFKLYPESVLAVWLEVPIAIGLGWMIYKKNANVVLSTVIAVTLMYASVALGAWNEHAGLFPSKFPADWPIPATGMWTILLLIYAWFASTLPVTFLLQPRDYMNAWQLFIMMGLLAAGIAMTAFTRPEFELAAPAIQASGSDTPPLFPMMFVIIACGAISGFHSLVAGGTSTKQLAKEPDALFVGYGSMLVEGALAVLVILCIAGGLSLGVGEMTGHQAWQHYYSSWMGAKGLGDNLAPVINGAANIMRSLGIPMTLGFAIMGVFVSSFAGTTLDTAVRIQRYVIGELADDFKLPRLSGRWAATTLAVLSAAALAFIKTEGGTISFGADATGAKVLWPLFGTVNQLLAALALLVVTMYLKRGGGLKYLYTAIPCLSMLTVTGWAMVLSEIQYVQKQNHVLSIIGAIVLALAAWMTVETIIIFCSTKKNSVSQKLH
jgi:carbon starvation protein